MCCARRGLRAISGPPRSARISTTAGGCAATGRCSPTVRGVYYARSSTSNLTQQGPTTNRCQNGPASTSFGQQVRRRRPATTKPGASHSSVRCPTLWRPWGCVTVGSFPRKTGSCFQQRRELPATPPPLQLWAAFACAAVFRGKLRLGAVNRVSLRGAERPRIYPLTTLFLLELAVTRLNDIEVSQ